MGGKFGVENAVSNLAFGGWKIWGGKCYLESPIWVGGKFGVENAVSNLEFGGWKICGGKCYLESRIWGVENLGGKCYLESRIWGVENLGWKMLSRISNFWGAKFGVESAISNLEFGGRGGGKFGVENPISKFLIWGGGWKIWGGKCCLESRIWGVENLGWKMLSRISNLGGGKFGVVNAISKFLIWGGG